MESNKNTKKYQIIVFLLTFLTYAALHSCRSAWAYAKDDIKKDPIFKIQPTFFGTIDLVFLLSYSISLYIAGWAGDKLNIKIFLNIGMLGVVLSFGSLSIIKFYNYKNDWIFLLVQAFHGVFQASGWPACLVCMGNWTESNKRGVILGFWSGCINFGNIVGYEFGSYTIDQMNIGWGYTILFACVFVFIVMLLNILFLKPYPEELGIHIHERIDSLSSHYDNSMVLDLADLDEKEKQKLEEKKKKINEPVPFFRALSIPGVPLYCIAYSCVKATTYGILFWLSPYLKDNGLEDHSARISQLNDLGQFFGGVVLGTISDKMTKKSIFLPAFMLAASVCFFLVKFAICDSIPLYYVYIGLGGFFLGGPYNMIASAISADLGRHPSLKGNKKALSTVSGIIEGSGSLASAVLMQIVPFVHDQIFILFMVMGILSTLILSPTAYREYLSWRKKKVKRKLRDEQNKATVQEKLNERLIQLQEN